MTKTTTRLVREGDLAAEVTVTLIEEPGGWSPYLSFEDALKLDAVRKALRDGDTATARSLARVYQLTPLSA